MKYKDLSERTQMILAGGLPLLLVGLFGFVSYNGLNALLETNRWVEHTHAVIAEATEIEKLIIDLETGQRGFLITGKDNFLEPYTVAKEKLFDELVATKQLVSDNPLQVKRLEELETLLNDWFEKSGAREINERRKVKTGDRGAEYLQAVLRQGTGKAILDNIRAVLDELDAVFIRANNQEGRYLVLAIVKDMVDMETGERGYLITGKEEFLQPYHAGQAALVAHISQINTLIDNANDRDKALIDINSVRRSVKKVEELAVAWQDKAAGPEIAIREEMNQHTTTMKDVTDLLETEVGKRIMDDMRSLLSTFKGTERTLMQERQAASDVTTRRTLWIVLLGTLLIAGFAIILLKTLSTLRKNAQDLEHERSKLEGQDWVKTSYTNITAKLQGLTDVQVFAETIMNELVSTLDAHLGLFYHRESDDQNEVVMSLLGSYAYQKRKNVSSRFVAGEGLVGQCALERKTILLTHVPEDYIRITSGSGETVPENIVVFPVLFEDQLLAVIEIASVQQFSVLQQELVDQIAQNIGVIFNNIIARKRTEELLAESQTQSEELQSQQEQLRIINEDLEAQTQRLKASEEELKQQGEELRVSNEELQAKQESLSKQKQELERAKKEVEIKAGDLAQASKYKSEFLANMSHELRTPLNSLLILSKMLADNTEGNLTEQQVEDARVIYGGGNDLLNLINDIMDLSKVEAGMLNISIEDVALKKVARNIGKLFEHTAAAKDVTFTHEQEDGLPATFPSDTQRLEQILKNFLSNAFKFTEKGSVTLKIHRPGSEQRFLNKALTPDNTIAFSVIDTGIGISKKKQQAIFEAFQQEDGSTSRKYGGTGLGLTISRELADLLGGEISLTSNKGKGSTFTLYLPLQRSAERDSRLESPTISAGHPDRDTIEQVASASTPISIEPFIADDSKDIHPGDKSVLIIEDDPKFAQVLSDIAHDNGFNCLVTNKGRDGLYLAMQYQPSSVLLDIGLPDISGLQVLEQLKYDLKTRHIPVHVISGNDNKQTLLSQGALGFLSKPAKQEDIEQILFDIGHPEDDSVKMILVIEDDAAQQTAIERLLQCKDIQLSFARTGEEACNKIDEAQFDCIILDLGLPDISGYDVLEKITELPAAQLPPVIVYTGQEISDEEQRTLSKFAADIIIKGAESPERLLDDVSLFLHSVEANLPEAQQNTIRMLHDADAMLKDRKILLVDDDARNMFALSRQLEQAGLEVEMADNGQMAFDLLEADEFIELILMDIMMPIMDGYEAMQKIRQIDRYADVPIIALTAKAMPEDREKCLAAGASEYLTKPVDMEKLLSMLRIWLYRHN